MKLDSDRHQVKVIRPLTGEMPCPLWNGELPDALSDWIYNMTTQHREIDMMGVQAVTGKNSCKFPHRHLTRAGCTEVSRHLDSGRMFWRKDATPQSSGENRLLKLPEIHRTNPYAVRYWYYGGAMVPHPWDHLALSDPSLVLLEHSVLRIRTSTLNTQPTNNDSI